MYLQAVSDLHLEFRELSGVTNIFQPCADVLILAGDICVMTNNIDLNKLKKLILWASNYYSLIVHVPGNHEFYCNREKMSMENVLEIGKRLSSIYPKYKFLNNESITYKDFMISGTTLWTNIPKVIQQEMQKIMTDYSAINYSIKKEITIKLNPTLVTKLHEKAVDFLKKSIEYASENNKKLIIVTHHKPYIGKVFQPDELIKFGYETDLTSIFNKSIKYWIYGHTHVYDNSVVNKISLYSNPKGYPRQKIDFKEKECLQIKANPNLK